MPLFLFGGSSAHGPCSAGGVASHSLAVSGELYLGSALFFGGSVIAAVLAGAVALFAPCCISVMLPAYFATAFHD